MSKIGIISNPRSHRNHRGLEEIRQMIAGHGDLFHREIDEMAGLPEILAEFASAEVGHIVVNGGDGTIQAVMTAALNNSAGGPPPTLAVLPSGRTNLIAHNIGLQGRPIDGLARLIARRGTGDRKPKCAAAMTNQRAPRFSTPSPLGSASTGCGRLGRPSCVKHH